MNHAHAASATPTACFDQHGVADVRRQSQQLAVTFRQWSIGTGDARNTRPLHRSDGGNLVAHESNGVGARADEDKTALFDALRKIGVFGQKTIARMYRLCLRDLGGADDSRNVQIAVERPRRTDTNRFVGESNILGLAVSLRVQRDRANAEHAAGALNAKRDLAAIGNDNLFQHSVLTIR